MVAQPSIPRPTERLVDFSGLPTPLWYAFLNRAQTVSDDTTVLQGEVTALTLRVDALEAGGGAFSIIGQQSVQVLGTPAGGLVSLLLLGDSLTPGVTARYGTDGSGTKGWFPEADAFEAETDELTKVVGSDGVTTWGLADVANAAGGTIQLTAFDAKGRATSHNAATTDDLPEGASNLYFTASRVRGTVLTGLNTSLTGPVVDTDTVLQAFGKLAGQQYTYDDLKASLVAGANITLTPDDMAQTITITGTGGGGGGGVSTVTGGTGISVDNTDPVNPVVALSSGSIASLALADTAVQPGMITGSGLTMATARLLGRTTASTGAVEEITVGSGLSLTAGTLAATGGAGTVTSVGITGSTGLTVGSSPITTSGTITLTLSSNLQAWSGVATTAVMTLAGSQTATGQKVFNASQISGMATSTGGLGGLSAEATSTGAAFMSFNRPGSFGIYLGLDQDNILKVGGWSLGSNAYPIYHAGLSQIIHGGKIGSSGSLASIQFQNRTGAQQWEIYNTGNVARFYNGSADVFTIDSAGTIKASGYVIVQGVVQLSSDSGLRVDDNIRQTGSHYNLNATSTAWIRTPRIFVGGSDPGAASSDGDIWIP